MSLDTRVISARAYADALLPPGSPRMKELARRRALPVVADTLLSYALIVLAVALVARAPSVATYALAFIVIGNRQYALSVLTHEGSHTTLFASRRWNDLFCSLFLCAPVGVDFRGEQQNHLAHHTHLATQEDPDRYLYTVEDKATRADLFLFLTGLTMFPRALRKALGRLPGPNASVPAGSFLSRRWSTFMAQALVAGAIAAVLPWWAYVVLWLGPIYPLVFVPHKIRMFCEHAHARRPDESVDSLRLVSYTPGLLERLVLAPHGLHFHAEHHLWPFVPYHRLSDLHALLVADGRVEIRGGYFAFLADYWRALPLRAAPAGSAAEVDGRLA